MKKGAFAISGFVTLWGICSLAVATEELVKYQFEKTIKGQKITVALEIGPFDSAAHTVRHVSLNEGYLIDGEKPIGNDGAIHATTEFKRFDIYWNGKKIPLPRHAWSSIFNVPLNAVNPVKSSASGLAVIPSVDGSSILFHFKPSTGDAEEPDEAWLVVDKKGAWQKFHSDILLDAR